MEYNWNILLTKQMSNPLIWSHHEVHGVDCVVWTGHGGWAQWKFVIAGSLISRQFIVASHLTLQLQLWASLFNYHNLCRTVPQPRKHTYLLASVFFHSVSPSRYFLASLLPSVCELLIADCAPNFVFMAEKLLTGFDYSRSPSTLVPFTINAPKIHTPHVISGCRTMYSNSNLL